MTVLGIKRSLSNLLRQAERRPGGLRNERVRPTPTPRPPCSPVFLSSLHSFIWDCVLRAGKGGLSKSSVGHSLRPPGINFRIGGFGFLGMEGDGGESDV